MKLFEESLPWYKGNLHLHTRCSDGRVDPEQAMSLYEQAGYDFLAITDHRKCAPQRQFGRMLVLSGCELDYTFPEQVVHIVGIGLNQALSPEALACSDANQGIAAIHKAGGLAILAHPHWSLNTLDILKSLNGLFAMEIFNTVSNIPWNGRRADSSAFADLAATHGRALNLVASDDAHFYNGDECKSFIRVNAPECSREALLDALSQGRFYASQGPAFTQIELTQTALIVECSPVRHIAFYSNRPWVSGRCTTGEGLTRAVYPLNPGDRYIRCTITDENGREAWCNPLVF
jgi:histidinol phosphatase-like PHP family hydrolase